MQFEPKTHLEWHSCYAGEFDCARLRVPMDYDNPLTNRTFDLAVIRIPAEDTENYLGSMFYNPGVRTHLHPFPSNAPCLMPGVP